MLAGVVASGRRRTVPAISYIGADVGVSSATVPTHAAGDLLVAFAFRDGTTTAPTLPAGWTDLGTRAGTTCSARMGYLIASAPGTASGTWTNATSLIVAVYRGASSTTPIGTVAFNSGATSNTVNFPALTLAQNNGTSWVAAAVGHRSAAPNLAVPPTGFVNRAIVTDATDEAALHDSNGGITSFAGETVTVAGGSAQGWITALVELRI